MNTDQSVKVLCPYGHTMWESINLSTLWKTYGLVFLNDHDYYVNTKITHQLNSDQASWCLKKCKVCFSNSINVT